MTNPFWAHIFAKRMSGYAASKHFGGPRSVVGKPAWSAFRYGQTVTELPDGRTLFVAGEHEDHYDPDFHIYNDVIVLSPGGGPEFHGYPHEACARCSRSSCPVRGWHDDDDEIGEHARRPIAGDSRGDSDTAATTRTP